MTVKAATALGAFGGKGMMSMNALPEDEEKKVKGEKETTLTTAPLSFPSFLANLPLIPAATAGPGPRTWTTDQPCPRRASCLPARLHGPGKAGPLVLPRFPRPPLASRIPGHECRIPDPRSWIPDPGPRFLHPGTGSRMPDP